MSDLAEFSGEPEEEIISLTVPGLDGLLARLPDQDPEAVKKLVLKLGVATLAYEQFKSTRFPKTITLSDDSYWQREDIKDEESVRYSLGKDCLPTGHALTVKYIPRVNLGEPLLSPALRIHYDLPCQKGEFLAVLAQRPVNMFSWEGCDIRERMRPNHVPYIHASADLFRSLPDMFQPELQPVYDKERVSEKELLKSQEGEFLYRMGFDPNTHES